MLKKLFRYEFGNTWMLPVLFNLIAVALTLVTGYQFRLLKPYMQTSEVPVALRVNQTISGFLLMALILFMVASNLILVLYFYVRFYKEIYSDVGYLMHTLPVTKRELLTAHTLVGGFWALEYGIMDIFCTVWMFIMVSKFSISFEEALYQLRRALDMQQWGASIWGRGIFILLLTLVLLLISPFLQMAKGFCAISLGQIFKSHRVFGSVLMYIVISIVLGLVQNLIFFFGIVPVVVSPDFGGEGVPGILRFGIPEQFLGDSMMEGPFVAANFLILLLLLYLVFSVLQFVIFGIINRSRMESSLNLE